VNNGQLQIRRSDAVTLTQTISGSGNFIQGGSGTTTLSGNNTYTGTTIVAGLGTVSVSSLGDGGSASGIGAATNSADNILFLSVFSTLKYTGAATSTDRLFTIGLGAGAILDASGTGAINFTNTGSIVLTPGGSTSKLTLTGTNTANNSLAAILGDSSVATSLTKSGVGTWGLSGGNTYTGITTISGGGGGGNAQCVESG
jgi:fibronectin-binding autotransporter adhesin